MKKIASKYFQGIKYVMKNIDTDIIQDIANLLYKKIIEKKKIFVAGNGGSAAIANHFFADFTKTINEKSRLNPRVVSLSNSSEIITAISNDINFNKIYSLQIECMADYNDCLIVFSCSGNSKNILEAISAAKKKKLTIILISGFKKKINKKIDYHLNLNCKHYGICEDLFSSLMHILIDLLIAKSNLNTK
jgi:phosphoheptose isomerase